MINFTLCSSSVLTSAKTLCLCARTRGTHLFRWLPGVVQRTRALYPGAERLALRLPGWMEWAWMQRCHGNWLQWWNRQRRRWNSTIFCHFPSLYLFLFCLSGRLSLLPCYFLFSFHLNKKRKNQPHCSSPSSHCAVPVLLRLPKSPAGHYYTEYVFVCVCMPLHFVRVCLSAFPLITAKCLICIPPARIKGTQRKFPKSKYSKPCIIDFCFFFAYGCQVSGGRWEVCVSRPCSCVFLAEERNISAMAGSLLITIIPSPYRSHLQLFYKIKKVVVRM